MVLQKRPEYESSGYHVPSMPHIPRSARGKRSVRRKVEDNQMCAFDLLATVAGKLLSERENDVSPCINTHGLTSSPTSAKDDVKEMRLKNFFKDEAFDQQIIRCHDIGRPSSESVLRSKEIDFGIKEDSFASKVPSSKLDYSVINAKPDKKGKDADEQVDEVPAVVGAKIENATDPVISSLPEKCSTSTPKQLGLMTPVQAERKAVVDDGMNERPQDHMSTSTSKDSMDLDTKHPALVSSENSVELVPVYMNHEIPPSSSFRKLEDGMELFIDKADDVDENCSRCTHPTILSSGEASRPQRIGYRRIRKLLASKYWKVAPPPMSQDNELSDYNHVDMKSAFCSKKLCYTRQRTQRGPFKRKKLFEQCSMSMGETYRECLSNLCEKGSIKKEANASHETLCEASGSPSSVTGQKSSHDQRDYHVKVNIKSFRVPELFIEIPETATVGSLKRTVMEAVTAILGGGLRVGVLLHGKKIRDDNKTLSQAGISHTDKLDNLGFTLEPKPTQTSVQTTSEEPHFFNLADPSARINPCNSPSSLVDEGNTTDAAATPQLVLATCPDQGGHDSMHSQLVDKAAMVNNSRALVVVPPANDVEALAVVPLRKPRRSEVAQRRIRRPFTVAEVEALVQTVEKLGTGRWRDVKLRAFDNAKHRTYVDLKDKWKTLVHTARISPQQRRGEPVPQELLDRVLSAHAYWSQQQAKLQIKPPPVDTCNLLI